LFAHSILTSCTSSVVDLDYESGSRYRSRSRSKPKYFMSKNCKLLSRKNITFLLKMLPPQMTSKLQKTPQAL
jgi:hypothetical protein